MKFSIYPTLCLIILSLTFFFQSCQKDDPEHIHEHELITRVTLEVTPSGGSTNSFTWNEGDNNLNVNLNSDTNYEVKVFFYNASDPSDIENVTEEVREEADEHLVFYDFTTSANLQVTSSSNDTRDSNQIPIGLTTTWTTSTSESLNAKLYLIHEPENKTANSRSSIGGGTDVEIDLAITIN